MYASQKCNFTYVQSENFGRFGQFFQTSVCSLTKLWQYHAHLINIEMLIRICLIRHVVGCQHVVLWRSSGCRGGREVEPPQESCPSRANVGRLQASLVSGTGISSNLTL